jgi:hypothetical protein
MGIANEVRLIQVGRCIFSATKYTCALPNLYSVLSTESYMATIFNPNNFNNLSISPIVK